MGWFGTLVELIGALYKVIRERINQRERDKLEDDPSGWFADHFDGVSSESDKTTTSKTNTTSTKTK